VKIQSPQPPVEGGPAYAKRFSRRLDVTLGAGERSLQHPTLSHGKVFGHTL